LHQSQHYGASLAAIAALVRSLMAVNAQGDEVLCSVVPQPAAKFPVMGLQVQNDRNEGIAKRLIVTRFALSC
jgi:hypothetical protein